MEEGDLNLCCHVFITGSFVKETCGSLMETQTRKPLWNYVLFRGSTSERHVFGSLSVTQSQPMWIYGQRIGQNGPQRNRAMLKSLCISVNTSRSWRLIHVQQRRPSGPDPQDQAVRTRPSGPGPLWRYCTGCLDPRWLVWGWQLKSASFLFVTGTFWDRCCARFCTHHILWPDQECSRGLHCHYQRS